MLCDIGMDMACVKNYYDKCIEVEKYLNLWNSANESLHIICNVHL